MKKVLLFAFVLFACCFLLDSRHEFNSVSAQTKIKEFEKDSAARTTIEQDREMAASIKRLTDRSYEGLVEKKLPEGFLTDLQGRFQNVMLSKIDPDGEPDSACVTSLEEANEFFGKNLETGEPVFSTRFQKDETAKFAAQNGMSKSEFEFYKNLIEDAAQRRADNPNSATITIVNGDGAGEGFNDPTVVVPEGGNAGTTLGQQRLNLFNFAAGIWGAYLDTNVPIQINAQFNSLTCTSNSGTLGSAGTAYTSHDFTNAPFANTDYHLALADKISGVAIGGSAINQINATFNSDVNNNAACLGGERFYYGYDNATPANTVNLLVVLLHEMGHGLGFSSFVTGTTGAFSSGRPDIFTRFMYDRSTGKYWYQMTDAERQTSALNTGNVLWDGANVKIASGFLTAGRDTATGRVQLFTPNPFQQGSSISHFDTAAYTNLLMEPVINAGLSTDLDLTRQQMRDIGWFRDTNADVTADSITNVLPSGSNIYTGSSKTITWTNNGGFNRNVTVELSTDGGTTYSTLASNIANTGSYTFTVPSTTTTLGRVRVREYDFANPIGVSASNFSILAPTAAPVSVSGRVTNARGRGISGARITVSKSDGSKIYAVTNAFGYFGIKEINVGASYVFLATRKGYNFAPQVVNVTQDLTELNFTAQP